MTVFDLEEVADDGIPSQRLDEVSLGSRESSAVRFPISLPMALVTFFRYDDTRLLTET